MVGPGAKVGDGIESRRPLSAPVLHSFIPSSLLFFCLLHLYWCVKNNNNTTARERFCPDTNQKIAENTRAPRARDRMRFSHVTHI